MELHVTMLIRSSSLPEGGAGGITYRRTRYRGIERTQGWAYMVAGTYNLLSCSYSCCKAIAGSQMAMGLSTVIAAQSPLRFSIRTWVPKHNRLALPDPL